MKEQPPKKRRGRKRKETLKPYENAVLDPQLCANVNGCVLGQCAHVKLFFETLLDLCSVHLQSTDCQKQIGNK